MIINASLHTKVEIKDSEARDIAKTIIHQLLKVNACFDETFIDQDGMLKAIYGRHPRETEETFREATELDKAIFTVLKELK